MAAKQFLGGVHVLFLTNKVPSDLIPGYLGNHLSPPSRQAQVWSSERLSVSTFGLKGRELVTGGLYDSLSAWEITPLTHSKECFSGSISGSLQVRFEQNNPAASAEGSCRTSVLRSADSPRWPCGMFCHSVLPLKTENHIRHHLGEVRQGAHTKISQTDEWFWVPECLGAQTVKLPSDFGATDSFLWSGTFCSASCSNTSSVLFSNLEGIAKERKSEKHGYSLRLTGKDCY